MAIKSKTRLIFGIFMICIYIGMAILLIFTDLFNIGFTLRVIIGVLFFLYGLFRAYRIKKYGL